MKTVITWLGRAHDWLTGPPAWRTWIAHSLLALLAVLALAVAFSVAGEAGGEWAGAGLAVGFYLGREIRDGERYWDGEDVEGFADSVMDWLSPTVVAVAFALVL